MLLIWLILYLFTCAGLSGGIEHFIVVARIITLLLASFRLLTGMFQLYQLGLEYMKDVVNWIEITLFICTIVFVSVFKTECWLERCGGGSYEVNALHCVVCSLCMPSNVHCCLFHCFLGQCFLVKCIPT